jgi:hypothetical protein
MGGEASGRVRVERVATAATAVMATRTADASVRRHDAEQCDACGEPMQRMGHCKWLCRCCGFLRTCIDTV